ncbi:MAG TPA: aminopeptidase [Pyrinomonadaceae bacterium]|nr:aminopeptidase [Pyrinomonadaceae bacterium]
MKKLLAPLAALAAALVLASCQTAPPQAVPAKLADDVKPAVKPPPTDLEQLAQRLVTQSAAVKEGESVLITGGVENMELLENIAVQVRKAGGFPLIAVGSDRLAKRMYTDVPEKYDSQTDQFDMKLAGVVNAVISLNRTTAEGLFADADPKRMAARAKANEAIPEEYDKHGVRTVEVGNGLYPQDWLAARYGMSTDDLAKTFWGGVNVDYTDLQTRGAQVSAALSAGNELHITDANGTDLKVKVQGRTYGVSDGIISAEDMKKGPAGRNVYLPAGEVYTTPVPGTAEGKVVLKKEYFQGKEINDLTLTFAAGKLTSITGSGPGFEKMKASYDAAGEGKDLFAVVDFGINPNVKLPAGSQIATWVPAGTVTVGVGNNVWAGGDNKTPYGYFVSLPGTTVTLDGKPVVEAGQLKL